MELPKGPLIVDERERRINVRFKFCMLAWYILIGGTLIYLMSNHRAAFIAWETEVFGSNFKGIVGIIIVIAMSVPVWIARMIVHNKTGVLVQLRGRK